MEEITKPEKVEADSLRDMSVVFFKSLNDFILFTSGYYEMAAEPPRESFHSWTTQILW